MNNFKNFYIPKDFLVFLFLVSLIILLVISVWYLEGIFLENMCDSNSLHDFIINNSDNRTSDRHEEFNNFSFYTSFKCRLSWYVLDKSSGKYSSFNEYKRNWDSSIRLRDIIKADLDRSRAVARKENERTRNAINRNCEIRQAAINQQVHEKYEARFSIYNKNKK